MLRLNKSYLILAVFVLLIAFLVRLMVYDYSLPYVENIDEPNLYTLANNWRGLGEDGWRKNFLEGYPPGYIVLSGVVMNNLDVLFNPDFDVDMALYIRWLRYVSVLANMLTIAIVIRIGWLLSSPMAGILSGLLLSLSIPFIVNGITALPDTYMVLLGAGAVLACLFAIRTTSWRGALIATILALLSIIFKYNNFPILLLPAYIFAWLLWKKRLAVILPSICALIMVLGTAYSLLFVYGAQNLDNTEAESVRNVTIYMFTEPARWEQIGGAVLETMGVALPVFAIIALIVLIFQRRLENGWQLLSIFSIIVPTFLLVFVFMKRDTIYSTRYTLAVPTLLIPLCYALLYRLIRWKPLPNALGIILLIPIIMMLPTTITQLQELMLPHTYAVAQAWFEENVDDQSEVWVEGYNTLRSLNRYEGGYGGFKSFATMYGKHKDDWEGDYHDVPYLYIAEDIKRKWPTNDVWPPLDELVLVKNMVGDNVTFRGPNLYIYSPLSIPNAQETYLYRGSDALILRGYDAYQDDSTIFFESYWYAPSPPPVDYSYVLYLVAIDDQDTSIVMDSKSLGARSTSTWTDPNELLWGGQMTLDLPSDLPSGDYVLKFAVYYWEDLIRLVQDDNSSTIDVLSVHIPAESD